MIQRRWGWLLALALLTIVLLAGAAETADWARYRPGRLQEAAAGAPTPGITVVIDVPIRARVQYTGKFRPLADDSRRHILTWAESLNVPAAPPAFRQEVEVLEDSVAYWLPVQDVLIGHMKAELASGEPIEVFAVYIGRSGKRPIFLVNEFLHRGRH